jgi:two-component sensor histidine kinase
MQTIETVPAERPAPEAQLLLQEFSHRINNEFASAIGVVSVAAARSVNGEARATLVAVRDQLHHYAQVHHALQMPEQNNSVDAAAYLARLCLAISRSKLHSRGIELLFVEGKFRMDAERCWRLGLIVSELITNSVRHALRDGGGIIRVELLPASSFVECRVSDNGKCDAGVRPGRGLRIIEALARSLSGTIDIDFGLQGTTAVLMLPLRS